MKALHNEAMNQAVMLNAVKHLKRFLARLGMTNHTAIQQHRKKMYRASSSPGGGFREDSPRRLIDNFALHLPAKHSRQQVLGKFALPMPELGDINRCIYG